MNFGSIETANNSTNNNSGGSSSNLNKVVVPSKSKSKDESGGTAIADLYTSVYGNPSDTTSSASIDINNVDNSSSLCVWWIPYSGGDYGIVGTDYGTIQIIKFSTQEVATVVRFSKPSTNSKELNIPTPILNIILVSDVLQVFRVRKKL